MTPRWKRAGPNGEIEITFKGQKYKIEKALDHNERHKGEFKIMVWNKRRGEWDWDNTVRGKAYAKELVMDKLNLNEEIHPNVVKAYKKTLDADDKAADYNHRSNKARVTRANNHLSKMIDKHHPGLDMMGKIKLRTDLQNMKEEATTTADAGIPKDTINMGKPKEYRVHDRRYRNKLKVMKRFKEFR